MADHEWRNRGRRAGDAARDEAYTGDEQVWRGAHGEVSEGEPPRYVGSQPGFGAHGMGYGPQGGSQAGSFGVYGVPHDVAQQYTSESRAGSPRDFDQPHGRMPFGWSGSFGSAGAHSARTRSVGPREQPNWDAPDSERHRAMEPRAARRGPKNYQRSDERIREDIYERLEDPRFDGADIIVEAKDGLVTLTGSVPHRAMKHWIEDLAADCPGVKDVDNRMRVRLAEGFL